MASPANVLRLCLRASRRLPSFRVAPIQQQQQQQSLLRRQLSTTPPRPAAEADEEGAGQEVDEEFDRTFSNPGEFLKHFLQNENITEEERKLASRMLKDWNKVPPDMQNEFDKLTSELVEESRPLRRTIVPKKDSFWNTDESDPDLITDEVGEDDFEEDDIMAMGHAKLEEHREFREYARIAVWEMPLLSSKPAAAVPPVR